MKKSLYKLLLIFIIQANAQHIPAKGNLGVKLTKAPENTYNAIFAIDEVMPNSTAQNLALQKGDILVKVNDVVLDSNQKIPEVIGKFIAGEKASATILRNGKLIKKKATIMAQTPFKKPNHELELLEIPFRNGYVRGFLTHPKGEGPFPTVYYVQGYPCQSINTHPNSPILELTNSLVDLGYAVFRIEKPGVGEYVNLPPCMENSFDDEIENFQSGYQFLESLPNVKNDEIYLFGHSLGGNVAPILAQKTTPAGVMVFGTLVKPWEDYILDMANYSHTYTRKATDVASKIPLLKSALQKLYVERIPHQNLTKEEKALITDWHNYKPEGFMFSRQISFWQNWNDYRYVDEWAKVKVPVLAMYGESDVHAISSLDTELIARIINQTTPGNGTYKFIENTNHMMATVSSRKEEMKEIMSGISGQTAHTKFNPRFPQIIHQWIISQKNKQKNTSFEEVPSAFPKSKTNMSSMDVVAADFNGDGQKDVMIATEFGPNRLFLYKNKQWILGEKLPELKTYTAPYLGEDSEDIAVSDFDRDGDLDVFFVSEDTQHHELLYNNGNGVFSLAAHQIPKTGQANAVLVYDFNQDGWDDILIGIRGQNELYINQKGEKFSLETDQFWGTNEDHTQDLILVDVDNDADLDIVEGIENGGNNLYLNNNGTFVEASERLHLPNDIETRKVIAADFDNDGDQDLFYCNVGWNPANNPQNQLLENDGKGNFKNITASIPKDATTTLDAIFQDVNDDGILDLITTNFVNDTKVKVFVGTRNKTNLFESNDAILPEVSFYGGTSVLPIDIENVGYLYFANFKSEDILLRKK
ncbi:MAG: FG-GAP-like repeat-containing protein [Bacteroidota bacterium]